MNEYEMKIAQAITAEMKIPHKITTEEKSKLIDIIYTLLRAVEYGTLDGDTIQYLTGKWEELKESYEDKVGTLHQIGDRDE